MIDHRKTFVFYPRGMSATERSCLTLFSNYSIKSRHHKARVRRGGTLSRYSFVFQRCRGSGAPSIMLGTLPRPKPRPTVWDEIMLSKHGVYTQNLSKKGVLL